MTTTGSIYRARRERLASTLRERGIAAARFEDFEHLRSPSVRYLCGHPGDAILVVAADASAALVPWDTNMAAKMAHVDMILPYVDFGRRSESAMRAALEKLNVPSGSRVEFPSGTPYPSFVDHVASLEEWDLVCENSGADQEVLSMRAVKDEFELAIYEKASKLTNGIMDAIEAGVKDGSLDNELDIALFIERKARAAGAEGTGFDTIAAGPARSFGIHAFPSYGAGPFGAKGFSILDFGIVIEGYTSDVTMTFVRGPLEPEQRKMLDLVREAYDRALAAVAPGRPARDPAVLVDELFSENGYVMPHSLGHGIGLEAHESPGVNIREENKAILKPGHIVTLEPGLYHPELGGVRLENDVLITENGCRELTSSRIVML